MNVQPMAFPINEGLKLCLDFAQVKWTIVLPELSGEIELDQV